MDRLTASHYTSHAGELAERYESADMAELHRSLLRHLPEQGRVLDIGCGSGRDAAFLQDNGFDVTAVDASAEMLATTRQHHPRLAGRFHQEGIPLSPGSAILGRQFEAIVSIATLMHIADQDLFETASQIRDLLVPGGILILSVSVGREGIVDNRDPEGRLFMERPPEELQLLFERLGFRLITQQDSKDRLGRQIRWCTLVMQRTNGQTPRSVDEIETIITRDKKVATYKLALFRSRWADRCCAGNGTRTTGRHRPSPGW